MADIINTVNTKQLELTRICKCYVCFTSVLKVICLSSFQGQHTLAELAVYVCVYVCVHVYVLVYVHVHACVKGIRLCLCASSSVSSSRLLIDAQHMPDKTGPSALSLR